jgi:hypothetical protein
MKGLQEQNIAVLLKVSKMHVLYGRGEISSYNCDEYKDSSRGEGEGGSPDAEFSSDRPTRHDITKISHRVGETQTCPAVHVLRTRVSNRTRNEKGNALRLLPDKGLQVTGRPARHKPFHARFK